MLEDDFYPHLYPSAACCSPFLLRGMLLTEKKPCGIPGALQVCVVQCLRALAVSLKIKSDVILQAMWLDSSRSGRWCFNSDSPSER